MLHTQILSCKVKCLKNTFINAILVSIVLLPCPHRIPRYIYKKLDATDFVCSNAVQNTILVEHYTSSSDSMPYFVFKLFYINPFLINILKVRKESDEPEKAYFEDVSNTAAVT